MIKKQHYVPRFYLRNFTFDKNKEIFFCYDKIAGKSFKTSIKNVAQENKFYEFHNLLPNEIEKKLSHFEATRWVPALAKLLKLKNFAKLNFKEKKDILHFLALQHIRTPYDKQNIVELYNAIARKSIEIHGEKSTLKLAETEEEQQKVYLSTIYGKDIDTSIEVKIDSFLHRRWNIMLNTKNKTILCTSDNPFALGNSSGFSESAYSNPGAIIYFPLTTNELLCSFDPKYVKRDNKEVLNEKEIHDANIAQIISSKRFIFQKTDNFACVTEFLKKFPIYRDLQPKFEVNMTDW